MLARDAPVHQTDGGIRTASDEVEVIEGDLVTFID
jgi:hypothetical protein